MKFQGLWDSFKKQYMLYPIAYLAKAVMRLLLWTCRIHVDGLMHLTQTTGGGSCILMLWHNRLAIMPEILANFAPHEIYCAFISQSWDGELLAILAQSYPIGRTLRVAHNARHTALSRMIGQLKQGGEVMVMTPDGPRGPRYLVKRGIVLAAKEASAKIIPITWSANRFWQLSSWDKLILPKPFSNIRVSIGAPIHLENNGDNVAPEETLLLQEALTSLDSTTCEAVSPERHRWPK